jgi:hypothetical protein
VKINRDAAIGCVCWSIGYAFLLCVCVFYGVRWIIGGQWLRGLIFIAVGCGYCGHMLWVLWDIFTEER